LPAIGRVGDGHKSPGLITVYTAGSLHRSRFDADIVIADEVHELCTDDKMESLTQYQTARMYGMTASRTTRTNNDWHRIEMVFGPVVYHIDYPTAESLGLVSSVVVQWLDIPAEGDDPAAGYKDLISQKRYGIWQNETRNRKIAAVASDMVNHDMQVLILVDTIEHAAHLKKHLPQFMLCYAENGLDANRRKQYIRQGLLQPDEPHMTAERRELLKTAFESRQLMGVIATKVWATGASFDGLNVLVRANGGSSKTEHIQQPGRVCRIDPATGKSTGVLVDCMDHFNPNFKRRSMTRRTSYHKFGWTQYNEDGSLWELGHR
jgi:superfamily II DNA or RNA helicase